MRRPCAAVTFRASGDCAVHSSSLLLAVALLRLVVVPASERAQALLARPPHFFNSLLVTQKPVNTIPAVVGHAGERVDLGARSNRSLEISAVNLIKQPLGKR